MELSVVIPARNEENLLPGQIDALTSQEWSGEWEIVVVDNASTDRTAAVVEEAARGDARIRLVQEHQPGLCPARNRGIRAAGAAAVAVCDADDLVAEGWVAAMGEALRSHELVTGSLEVDRLNPPWLAASRGRAGAASVPTFHGLFVFPHGNNFGIRRELFDRIGGFDQTMIGAEDVELGLRAWLADIDVHFVPDALVHYRYRDTPRDLWRQGLAYGLNRPAIARKLTEAGRTRPARAAGWRSWAWLLLNSPRVVTPRGRALLAWVGGNRIGHLVGSLRHRTILL